MTSIGLLSDTHNFLDPDIFEYFKTVDEIWHAGDIGTMKIADELSAFKPFKAVYGNIDGNDVRFAFPEQLLFFCEEVKVMIKHIGGYPPNYNPATKKELINHQPGLFIAGHSHILKVMYDDRLHCLHLNPGAAGRQGWQKVRTVIRFKIDGTEIKECEVIEMPR